MPPKHEPSKDQPGIDDVKVKAVNEMMERIKHGVMLRPVTQISKRKISIKPPPLEEKTQESAMEELKGILDSMKKSPSRGFPDISHNKTENELEAVLRRRRKQTSDYHSRDGYEAEASEVNSSKSLSLKDSDEQGSENLEPSPVGLQKALAMEEAQKEQGSKSPRSSKEMKRKSSAKEENGQPQGILITISTPSDLPDQRTAPAQNHNKSESQSTIHECTDADC
eukprot:gi/632948335/ref/XP_007889549.1/ PREDICTED: shootin-1-like [Callorhinchus milii]